MRLLDQLYFISLFLFIILVPYKVYIFLINLVFREFDRTFSRIKNVEPIKILRHLRDTKNQHYEENLKKNIEDLDPEIYLNKSIQTYGNYLISG